MDLLQAIRLLALKAVVQPDREYFFRRVMRWYSKTFFTPLAQVEELPLEDVLQAYYEEEYASMTPEEIETATKELLVTDDQRYQQILAEEADEVDMFEMSKIMEAEERRKKIEAKKAAQDKTQGLADTGQKSGLIRPVEMPETDLPVISPKKMPEGITMTFIDESEFEAELEGFGLMTQPKK